MMERGLLADAESFVGSMAECHTDADRDVIRHIGNDRPGLESELLPSPTASNPGNSLESHSPCLLPDFTSLCGVESGHKHGTFQKTSQKRSWILSD